MTADEAAEIIRNVTDCHRRHRCPDAEMFSITCTCEITTNVHCASCLKRVVMLTEPWPCCRHAERMWTAP